MIVGCAGSPISLPPGINLPEKEENWLDTQDRTIRQLQDELGDVTYLSDFSKKCDDLSDALIQKPQTAADFAWNTAKEKYIARTKWTYPFDDSRTCKDIEGFFINASDLELEGQKYVASQAPLTTTFADFWKMMIQTKSTTIVALNMPEEDKDEPEPWPVEYWKKNCLEKPFTYDDWKTLDPSAPAETVITFDNWTVTRLLHEVVATEEGTDFALVKRQFKLTNSQTNETRTITQFHFQNWPDFEGAPTDRLFRRLLELVEASHTDKDVPVTVHCAAGMGRAGSFIAAHALRRQIQGELASGKTRDEIKVNLAKTIFAMRQCRKDMVAEKGMPCIATMLS